MKQFRVSKVMMLVALIKFELENNSNVRKVATWADVDVDNAGINEFSINAKIGSDNEVTIGLRMKDSKELAITINTIKSIKWSDVLKEAADLTLGRYVDDDRIVITQDLVSHEATRYSAERCYFPCVEDYNLNAWRSMACDIVGMALKEYNK